MAYCSPSKVENFKKSGTCFDLATLVKIATAFNRQFPSQAIASPEKQTLAYLKQELETRLKKECQQETCWVAKLGLEDDPMVEEHLRPRTPEEWLKKPNTWLTNFNIEAVMFQYEKMYPSFKFLGVFPLDFEFKYAGGTGVDACMYREVCTLDISAHKYIGFIINLDRHDESGSHWTAIFIKDKVLYYYDSTGRGVPKEVSDFAKKHKLKVVRNVKVHQKGHSECGMFAMYYIIRWLTLLHQDEGTTFKTVITSDHLTDANMFALRKVFFRPMHQFKNASL